MLDFGVNTIADTLNFIIFIWWLLKSGNGTVLPTKIWNARNGTAAPEAHRPCDMPARLAVSVLCLRVYILQFSTSEGVWYTHTKGSKVNSTLGTTGTGTNGT